MADDFFILDSHDRLLQISVGAAAKLFSSFLTLAAFSGIFPKFTVLLLRFGDEIASVEWNTSSVIHLPAAGKSPADGCATDAKKLSATLHSA
jgi:hypothetical protein